MSYVVTALYVALLAWGLYVGVRQVYQGYRLPAHLLNPLMANRHALRLYTVHLVVCVVFLFAVGPWAIAHKSMLWYWGGTIAMLSISLPLAAFFNRNPQSFGSFIGQWVKLRNYFEYAAHIVVAAVAVNWSLYTLLLWWIVAYRFLDVGPRRSLQKLYATPDKLAARPWAPTLNWAVIAGIYVLAFVVVKLDLVMFANVPGDATPTHNAAAWEIAVVLAVNLGLTIFAWLGIKAYSDSVAQTGSPDKATASY